MKNTLDLSQKTPRNRKDKLNEEGESCKSDDLIVVNNLTFPNVADRIETVDDNESQRSILGSAISDSVDAQLRLAKAQLQKQAFVRKCEQETQMKLAEFEDEIKLAKLKCKLLGGHNSDEPISELVEDKVEPVSIVDELRRSLSMVTSISELPKLEMVYFDGQPKLY